MKTNLMVILVTMVSSMTTVAADAPLREQQYRAKYGRFTPAYEAQLKAVPANEPSEPSTPECCHSLRPAPQHKVESRSAIIAEERNRVKYGRFSPAKEAQVRAAADDLANHALACRKLNQCPISADTSSAAGSLTSSDARSLMKYGKIFGKSPKAILVSASRSTEPCEHPCCQHAE